MRHTPKGFSGFAGSKYQYWAIRVSPVSGHVASRQNFLPVAPMAFGRKKNMGDNAVLERSRFATVVGLECHHLPLSTFDIPIA